MSNDAGQLLIRAGLVTEQQIMNARRNITLQGGTLGEHLVMMGAVDDEKLTQFYHQALMVPRANPNRLAQVPRRSITLVPADMASEFRLVPVRVDGDLNLTLAMSDPANSHAVDEIAFFTSHYVMRQVATQTQIAWCLAHYYDVVTPLGETLMQEAPAKAKPTTAAKGKPSARRRVLPPLTSPIPRPSTVQPTPDPLAKTEPVTLDSETHTPTQAEQSPPAGVPKPQEDAPVLLVQKKQPRTDRPSTGVPIQPASEEDGVIILSTKKRRNARSTDIGVGLKPRPPSNSPVPVENSGTVRDRAPSEDQATAPTQDSAPRALADEADTTVNVIPSPQPEHDDDGFGPPGTTIPPPLLAANLEDEPKTAIPLRVEDEVGSGAASEFQIKVDDGWEVTAGKTSQPRAASPSKAASDRAAAENTKSADSAAPTAINDGPSIPFVDPSESHLTPQQRQRELERASLHLVETLRDMDRADSRTAVLDVLINYFSEGFARIAFFAVQSGKLSLWRAAGYAPPDDEATLKLDSPSTFQDIVRSRLPFRGTMKDPASTQFLVNAVGEPADWCLAVPITIRDRCVGVLYADNSAGHIFHEHLSVIFRAAGDALERVLKSRKLKQQ